jgi:hypothetical protein
MKVEDDLGTNIQVIMVKYHWMQVLLVFILFSADI